MNKRALSAALTTIALVGAITAAPARADTLVSAEQPEAILEIAKGFGSAELKTDPEGDPVIDGRMSGTLYSVFFYRCSGGKDCENIQFSAGWSGYRVSPAQIHAWNRQSLFGKAYIDEVGDPILEMAVNLKFGVTRKNLDDTFDWWKVVLKDFEDEVLEAADAKPQDVGDKTGPI